MKRGTHPSPFSMKSLPDKLWPVSLMISTADGTIVCYHEYSCSPLEWTNNSYTSMRINLNDLNITNDMLDHYLLHNNINGRLDEFI